MALLLSSMKITETQLDEFVTLYEARYGLIGRDNAREAAESFLGLVSCVYRPIKMNIYVEQAN